MRERFKIFSTPPRKIINLIILVLMLSLIVEEYVPGIQGLDNGAYMNLHRYCIRQSRFNITSEMFNITNR